MATIEELKIPNINDISKQEVINLILEIRRRRRIKVNSSKKIVKDDMDKVIAKMTSNQLDEVVNKLKEKLSNG